MSDDFSTNCHGPNCPACAGKGWLNTADQNRREDQLAALLRVAEAARIALDDLCYEDDGYDPDDCDIDGPEPGAKPDCQIWKLIPDDNDEFSQLENLRKALAALPAPGERKAGE